MKYLWTYAKYLPIGTYSDIRPMLCDLPKHAKGEYDDIVAGSITSGIAMANLHCLRGEVT
jgi:hypothetical protein